MIRLEKITERNYKECLDLSVSEDQSGFVSSNAISLAKAYVYYDITTPLAIYDDDTMVGFMLVRFDVEYSLYFVWQLMIDKKYQGRGYGKQAMSLAISWMKEDKRCKEICLTYKAGNTKARRLYKEIGFTERVKEVEDGEIDMMLRI